MAQICRTSTLHQVHLSRDYGSYMGKRSLNMVYIVFDRKYFIEKKHCTGPLDFKKIDRIRQTIY